MPNAFGNIFMKMLITSPLHFVLGANFAVVSLVGRKTGKTITTPINVVRDGQTYTVISMRDRTWWRNLYANPIAQLCVGGKTYKVEGKIVDSVEAVSNSLQGYFLQNKKTARYFGVRFTSAGQVEQADLARVASERIIIRFQPIQ